MLERLWKTEPARLVSAITAALTAIFSVVAAFGLPISDAQQTAILGAVAPIVAAIMLAGEIIRGQVTPVKKAQDKIDAAYQATPGQEPKPRL